MNLSRTPAALRDPKRVHLQNAATHRVASRWGLTPFERAWDDFTHDKFSHDGPCLCESCYALRVAAYEREEKKMTR